MIRDVFNCFVFIHLLRFFGNRLKITKTKNSTTSFDARQHPTDRAVQCLEIMKTQEDYKGRTPVNKRLGTDLVVQKQVDLNSNRHFRCWCQIAYTCLINGLDVKR